MLVGYLVGRSEADLVAGRRRRSRRCGVHGHAKHSTLRPEPRSSLGNQEREVKEERERERGVWYGWMAI